MRSVQGATGCESVSSQGRTSSRPRVLYRRCKATYFEARLHTDDQVELSDAYGVTEALVHFPMSHYGLFFPCDCDASFGTYRQDPKAKGQGPRIEGQGPRTKGQVSWAKGQEPWARFVLSTVAVFSQYIFFCDCVAQDHSCRNSLSLQIHIQSTL